MTDLALGRYELRGELGSGGMGVVHRVLDRVRGREVALKVLRATEGRDLFRFKREFRALADLVHPNLVALHELTTDGREWMFAMELVEGVPFSTWVAGDERRLRAALGQLADGLTALHDAGKLHRDLKPSNVLVEPGPGDGRVVILDFGLVADVERGERTHEHAAIGTPAFMSPEQAADLPLTAAADWYAVGVMLYEALTGRRPHTGSSAELLRKKRDEDPPPPRTLVPTVPADLDALCMALLDRDPARRPDGRAVLAALGRAPSAATEAIARAARRTPFVGRDAERAALRASVAASRRAGSVVHVVIGASGLGKTALMRACLDELRAQGDAVVLAGRCYEREAVPYKTLDGVVDELTAYLVDSGDRTEGLGARDVASLLRLFPVLRRVGWMNVPALPGVVPTDPAELRRRALGALRAIFDDLTQVGPLVIAIDDLQWGDVDGAIALAEIIDGPADTTGPGVVVVATHREEDAATAPALAALRRRVPHRLRELTLGALPDAEARTLWRHLAGDAAAADDSGAVHDAAGSPLLLGEIAQARAAGAGAGRIDSVEAAVRVRMAQLDAAAHALLDVVALATRPLRLALAPGAAGIADVDAAVQALRAHRLVRVRGADPVIEARHDRIRGAVAGTLTDARRREVHAGLAATLAATDGDHADPAELIEHWLGAGETERAAALAEPAAADAEDRLAYHRAAELLGLALRREALPDDEQRALRARRGRALAAIGRLAEAADELRAASRLAAGRERLALERGAVENLLRAGELDRGLDAARGLLREVGERLPRRPLLAAATARARLRMRGMDFTSRAEAAVAPDELDRLDALASVASGVSFAAPVLGVALQARLLRRALDAGEPRRIAIALGSELGVIALSGEKSAPRRRGVEVVARRLADELDQPDVVGVVEAGVATGAYLSGRFRDGAAAFDAALARMRDRPGAIRWQLDLAEILRVVALWWLGDLRALVRAHAAGLRAAEDGGSVEVRRHLCSWPGSVVWLLHDEPATSRARLDASTPEPRPDDRFHLYHYHALAGRAHADLYERRAGDAHARIEAAWRAIEGAGVLRVQLVELEARYLRGAAAIAARGRAGARLAAAQAAKLERHGVAHGDALAAALRASVARVDGMPDAAIAQLRDALHHAERADTAALAAALRRRLGQLHGGAHGAAMITAADDWLRAQGVVAPAAFAAMLVPRVD